MSTTGRELLEEVCGNCKCLYDKEWCSFWRQNISCTSKICKAFIKR